MTRKIDRTALGEATSMVEPTQLAREPILIEENGEPVAAIISAEDC